MTDYTHRLRKENVLEDPANLCHKRLSTAIRALYFFANLLERTGDLKPYTGSQIVDILLPQLIALEGVHEELQVLYKLDRKHIRAVE